jgi:hypothetical protein
VDYKNKQLMEKIMLESSLRYHTKKEGYPNLSSDINELGKSGPTINKFYE